MESKLRCVILAAGMGTRLGLPEPKPLTEIANGMTILDRQLTYLRDVFGDDVDINIVVGHEAHRFDFLKDQVQLILNPDYATTNTSKSLLIALKSIGPGPVLWMNGDVVFRKSVLEACAEAIPNDQSFMVVNTAETGDEEVKHTTDDEGFIIKVGKNVIRARGEAVGINFFAAPARDQLTAELESVEDQEYFEGAIQAVISSKKSPVSVVIVSDDDAIEIDTVQDLSRAVSDVLY